MTSPRLPVLPAQPSKRPTILARLQWPVMACSLTLTTAQRSPQLIPHFRAAGQVG